MGHQMTFDEALDGPRLGLLAGAVAGLMEDGCWRTLGEIQRAVKMGSEAGISARLRELRRKHGHDYEKRRRGDGRSGLWEYRFLV
jgi:hypothetical protein